METIKDNRELNAVYIELDKRNYSVIVHTAFMTTLIRIGVSPYNIIIRTKIKRRYLFKSGYYLKLSIKVEKVGEKITIKVPINKYIPIKDLNEAINFSEYIKRRIYYEINQIL